MPVIEDLSHHRSAMHSTSCRRLQVIVRCSKPQNRGLLAPWVNSWGLRYKNAWLSRKVSALGSVHQKLGMVYNVQPKCGFIMIYLRFPVPPLSFQIQREVLSQIWRVSNPGPGPKALKSRSNPRVSNSWMVCMRLAFLLSMAWQRLNETQLLVDRHQLLLLFHCQLMISKGRQCLLKGESPIWICRLADWISTKKEAEAQSILVTCPSEQYQKPVGKSWSNCFFFMEIPSSCSVIVLNIFLHSVFNPPYSHQATINVQSHRLKRTCTSSWFDLH